MEKYTNDWEELAKIDPKWAILSDPRKKFKKWNNSEFFERGKSDMNKVLSTVKKTGVKIRYKQALDFGCGIGRVTKAMSRYFDKVYGIDISKRMIAMAKEIHKDNKKMKFFQNLKNDLSIFKDNKFDLVYSYIVLQHIPKRKLIEKFLMEFIRVTRPGGIIYFQLPTIRKRSLFLIGILTFRGKIFHLLTKFGFSGDFCFKYLKLAPHMYMSYISSKEVIRFLSKKVELLKIKKDKSTSTIYLFQKK
jgi:ubiquinone/menaquinone biosynthesis C-methylase UbiE